MNKKVTGIVAYISQIGWIIAFCAGDKEGAKYHLNQSLVLWIVWTLLGVIAAVGGYIPVVGLIISLLAGICNIVLFVFWILGLINVIKEEEKPLPLIGGIQILK